MGSLGSVDALFDSSNLVDDLFDSFVSGQEGFISDGDGQYVPGVDDCSWIVAPSAAASINIQFLFFDMSPDNGNHMYLTLEECDDVTCADSVPLPSSPLQTSLAASKFSTLQNIASRILRVTFVCLWSGHTQARFLLRYTSSNTSDTTCGGLATGSWYHIYAVVERTNETSASARVYSNGKLMLGPLYSTDSLDTYIADSPEDTGISLARIYPMSPPFGYLHGAMDDVAVWNRSLTDHEIADIMITGCANKTDALACFSFDEGSNISAGSYENVCNSHRGVAVALQGDQFLPWCTSRDDGGELLVLNNVYVGYEQSWGFCTDKPYLPGLGFDYDADVLASFSLLQSERSQLNTLLELPACVTAAIVLEGNSAGR